VSLFKRELLPPDRKHLEFVCSLPCVITHAENGIQAHHLLRDVMRRIVRGASKRAEDKYVIPLHFAKHTELHLDGNETRWLAI